MTYREGIQPELPSRPTLKVYQRALITLVSPIRLSGYKWFRELVGGYWCRTEDSGNLPIWGVIHKGWYPVPQRFRPDVWPLPNLAKETTEYEYDFKWPKDYWTFFDDDCVFLDYPMWFEWAHECGFGLSTGVPKWVVHEGRKGGPRRT
jgi:hypothetical protein